MIPFIDLNAQQKLIRNKIDKRIKQVLDHGQYILGPEVKELEDRLSSFTQYKEVNCYVHCKERNGLAGTISHTPNVWPQT